MNTSIDPQEFGLPPRTVLEQVGASTIAVVLNRKSRIIMADGRKILETAAKIRKIRGDVSVVLKTSAPVCSKTRKFLNELGIEVLLPPGNE